MAIRPEVVVILLQILNEHQVLGEAKRLYTCSCQCRAVMQREPEYWVDVADQYVLGPGLYGCHSHYYVNEALQLALSYIKDTPLYAQLCAELLGEQ